MFLCTLHSVSCELSWLAYDDTHMAYIHQFRHDSDSEVRSFGFNLSVRGVLFSAYHAYVNV